MNKRVVRSYIKEFLPPFFLSVMRRRKQAVSWKGDYVTWEGAKEASTGYDGRLILHKVKEAALRVKRNQAAFERDSVVFGTIEYNWSLLSGLLWAASRAGGKLHVVDFGGSLGSTFFQHKIFLQDLPEIAWYIVEQTHFVDCGREYFETVELKFFESIAECLEAPHFVPNVIILSSVLQYLEKPYEMLQYILNIGIPTIIFDRTPFTLDFRDRLTVQVVSRRIYQGSYPCWFFDSRRFYSMFKKDYSEIASFDCRDSANIPSRFAGGIFSTR